MSAEIATAKLRWRDVLFRKINSVAPIAEAVAYKGPPVKICGVILQTTSRSTPPPTAVMIPNKIATKSDVRLMVGEDQARVELQR